MGKKEGNGEERKEQERKKVRKARMGKNKRNGKERKRKERMEW